MKRSQDLIVLKILFSGGDWYQKKKKKAFNQRSSLRQYLENSGLQMKQRITVKTFVKISGL